MLSLRLSVSFMKWVCISSMLLHLSVPELFIIQCDLEIKLCIQNLTSNTEVLSRLESSTASIPCPCFYPTEFTPKMYICISCELGFHRPSCLFLHTVAVKERLSVLNFMLECPQFNTFLKQPFECSEKWKWLFFFSASEIAFFLCPCPIQGILYARRKCPWCFCTVSFWRPF